MSTIIPILIFLLILGVVVFIHELGHFLAARRAGVFVEEFALGMGPVLFSFKGKPTRRKHSQATPSGPPKRNRLINFWEGGAQPDNKSEDTSNLLVYNASDNALKNASDNTSKNILDDESVDATQFSLRLFPIGGFCRMHGQDDEHPGDSTALGNKTVGQRMLVMAGGSLMNFILAFILFFTLTVLTGYRVAEVRGIVDGRPAYHAGLQEGDRITHINGNRVTLYENFLLQLEFSGGEPMDIRFIRDGERHEITLTPFEAAPGLWRIGFFHDIRFGLLDDVPEGFNRIGVWGSLTTSAEMMLFNIRLPFTMLARWVTNQHMPAGAGVMGPIGMAGELTALYQHTIETHGVLDMVLTMVFFTAILSTALGLFNLLPIPAMDGARLVFLFIEGIRRRPIPPEREGMVHLVGFVLIIGLAIFIAYRDIIRLLPS